MARPTPGVTPPIPASGNASQHIKDAAGSRTARVTQPDSQRPGADLQREFLLQGIAARYGLAPQVLSVDLATRRSEVEFVAGAAWIAADFSQAAQVRRLCLRLRDLHALPVPDVPRFDLRAVLVARYELLCARKSLDALERGRLMRWQAHALQRLAESGHPRRVARIVHCDLHAGNIVDSGELRFIDWEYAQISDPLVDLAAILTYYPGVANHGASLLEWSGRAADSTLTQLSAVSYAFLLINWYWCQLRACGNAGDHGETEFATSLARRLDAMA